MRKIKKIIVHCSASDYGDAKLIRKWHLERGWSDIGYHYVILNGIIGKDHKYDPDRDGEIQIGRDITRAGAHVKGQNQNSIGICLIGNHHFSGIQIFKSLPILLILLLNTFNLGLKDIYGHNRFNKNKTCPNIPMEDMKAIVSLLNDIQSESLLT